MILEDKIETLTFQFEDSYYCSGEIGQSFADKFNKLVELKEIEPMEFEDELGLSGETFRSWKKA